MRQVQDKFCIFRHHQSVCQIFFDIKRIILVEIGKLFVPFVLCDVIFVAQKRPVSSKLSVSNICCMKIITPCNINRQRILMIPCFIFYRNPEYACKHISRSPFNSFSFVLTFAMLRVKFLSYFDFSKILFSHTLYFPPPSFVYVRGFVD